MTSPRKIQPKSNKYTTESDNRYCAQPRATRVYRIFSNPVSPEEQPKLVETLALGVMVALLMYGTMCALFGVADLNPFS